MSESYLRPIDEVFLKSLKTVFRDFKEGDRLQLSKAQANALYRGLKQLDKENDPDFIPTDDEIMEEAIRVTSEFFN